MKKIMSSILFVLLLCSTVLPVASAQTQEVVNLALHRPYTVTSTIVDSSFHRIQTTNYPDDGTKLTDGIIGPNQWMTNGSWVGYLRQDDHQVTLDLGERQTIHELHAWFLQDKGAGIYFPQEVKFEVSNNGKTWMKVAEVKTQIPLSQAGVMTQDYAVEGLNIAAQYVRMTFHADVYVFLSELEVMGLHGVQPGAEPVRPTPERHPQHNYPLAGSKQANGKKAQVLIYSGYTTTPGLPQWNKDELIPYVAYVDEHMQIQDYMFDSFLMLPFGNAPSGGNYGIESTKADWSYYIDQLFEEGYRLDALDQAVAEVNHTLKKGGKKFKGKVVIAIPYPNIQSDWGDGLDFNPETVGEDQSLANRLQAVQWYLDTVLSKWEDAGFENLELNGFYWFREGMGYSVSTKDEDLVRGTADMVHNAGPYSFDWIPAGQNPGFHKWKEYGFDTALMQPNYAFSADLPPDRLKNNAILAKRYGLGVEMEIHWNVIRTDELGELYRNNYYEYLDAAHEFHYQNSFLAWYQNTDTLLISARSDIPEIREIYDQTYRFIKGTYQPR